MFGSLGFPELMFIFVIALILFGPRQLPKIGQSLGRALGEFRRASNEFKRTVEEEVAAEEIRAVERDLRKVTEPPKSDSEDAEPAKEPAEKPAEKPGDEAADSSGKESGGA
ncbi:MAG: twin-arginine translocase subunit TatB [Acidobacteria bacterium]|nr:twin-arginine translocase subunit TatB [Acidobacteriota bacterium]